MPTNGMTIDGLNTVSSLTAQDKVPVWDNESSGEPTRKITAQDFTNSVKTLGSLVNTTEMNTAIEQSTADVIRTGDVVNNLNSAETQKPGSANMLKALNDKITIHDSGSVTVTPASGVTVSVAGAKSADIKYLRFTISNTSLTYAKEICTIPSEWYPVAARPYFTALNDDDGSIVGTFILNPTGKLIYFGQTTNDTVICCGLYI